MADIEQQYKTCLADKALVEDRLKVVEARLNETTSMMRREAGTTAEMDSQHQRIIDEHQKDLEDRDFAFDLTRQKYQNELLTLSEGECHNLRCGLVT